MTTAIDIYPKAQLAGAFTQSTFQSIDTKSSQTAALQVWVDGLGAAEQVDVTVEESDFNEETDYATSDDPIISLSSDGTSLTRLSLSKRFMRLRIEPTLSASLAVNVRAQLLLDV